MTKKTEWTEVEINSPNWYDCIPAGLGVEALAGNGFAREVCRLIEYAFNEGYLTAKDGKPNETDIEVGEKPSADICRALIREFTALHTRKARKETKLQ